MVFNGSIGQPEVWNGGGATCTSESIVSTSWGILENANLQYDDDNHGWEVENASFIVVRHTTDVGTGTDNGTTRSVSNSSNVVI